MGWYKVTVDPSGQVLTTSETKNHLKVDSSDDDTLIDNLISVATEICQDYTRRLLLTQTVECYLDSWDDMIINRSPIQSISKIEYYNSNNELTELDSSTYDVDIVSEPARITLADGKSWPTLRSRTNPIIITFVAGYGTASDIPDDLKQGMLSLIGHLYENRQDVIVGRQVNSIPKTSQYLWDNKRVFIYK